MTTKQIAHYISKNSKTIGRLCFVAAILCVYAVAQQPPKVEPKTYTLPPEASKAIIQLEAQRKAINDEIDKNENFVFVGASVPADSRQCGWDASGIVTCKAPPAKPELPSPTPKP